MAQPYSLAIDRYQSEKMRAAMKTDPVEQLAKIMGLQDMIGDIKAAGDDAFVALCGVVLYRHLERHEQTDVLQRIQSLIARGHRRLGGRLQSMVATNIAQPEWNLWSMNGAELREMAKTNKEVKDFIEDTGLDLDFSKITMGALLYSMSKTGVKGAALEWSGGKAVAEAAAKRIGGHAAERLGWAYFVVLAIGTGMKKLSEYDENRAENERDSRRPPAD